MIGVYTALFGVYDKLHEPEFSHVDFRVYTDQPGEYRGWQVQRVEPPHEDPRYASRYYFDQSCLAMPDHEYTIMHGANAQLTAQPEDLIAFLPDGIDILCCKHPRRNVYEEAEACIRMNKDRQDIIEAQMERYRREGFPQTYPLSACILMIRRNTPRLKEFEAFWWRELSNNSCRDQLSFDYCRWKFKMKVHYLPRRWDYYIRLRRHAYKKVNK